MTISRMTTGACFLLASALLSPVWAQADKSVAARLQRLENVEQIQRVLLDYGRSLDAHDFAAYSRLFAKDGEWVGGFGSVRGPAAIQAFMEKNIGPLNKPGATYHLLSNFEIDVHGDTATAWSRWAYVIPGADKKPVIAQGGHYDDTFVRENGQWKFQRRVAVTDVPHFDPTEQK
jgi:ketosteroid isomerase-like protein